MDQPLPSFRDPPVVETVLSIQFEPLKRLRNAHLGLFWSEMRDQYPNCTDMPPIEPQTEEFGEGPAGRVRLPKFQIRAVQPTARLQMASSDGHTMVQVQNGRLLYNWQRLAEGTYPRWSEVLPGFEKALARFQSFLKAEGIGDLQPNQWEVTYVNHLIRGREWESPSDWSELIPGLIGTATRLQSEELETLSANWHFILPEKIGRLHVDFRHGFTGAEEDAKELLVLQFTGRGRIAPEEGWDLSYGLDAGRRAIVETFAAITGERAHTMWGRQQ